LRRLTCLRTDLFAAGFEDACAGVFEFVADWGLVDVAAGAFEAVVAFDAVGVAGTAAAAGFEGDCGAVAWAPN